MPVLHQLQPSFNNGEISPLLYDRVDYNKFTSSVKSGKNMFVHPQGGMSNRAGTKMLGMANGEKVRLIPFEFSNTETYMIEFGDFYCRFYTTNGQVVTEEGNPYEIESPFSANDLDKIRYCQSGDVMYIAWGGKPRTLTRHNHTDWRFSEYNNKNGPIKALKENFNGSFSYIENSAYIETTELFSEDDFYNKFQVNAYFPAQTIAQLISTNSVVNSVLETVLYVGGNFILETKGSWAGSIFIEESDNGVDGWRKKRVFSSSDVSNGTNYSWSDNYSEEPKFVRINCSDLKTFATTGLSLQVNVSGFYKPVNFILLKHIENFKYEIALIDDLVKIFEYVAGIVYSGKVIIEQMTTPHGAGNNLNVWLMEVWLDGVKKGERQQVGWEGSDGRGWGYTWTNFLSTVFGEDLSYSHYDAINIGITCEQNEELYSGKTLTLKLTRTGATGSVKPDGSETISGIFTIAEAVSVHSSQPVNSFLWRGNTYPNEVDIYQNRIVWSTNNQLDATKISDYTNFGVSTDVTSDDSISVIIKDKKINKINSIVAGSQLVVFTDSGNFIHNNDTFTPSSATFLNQGSTGGADVKPVIVRDNIIYVHPMKQAISDYTYNFETDGYAGQDITILANHLFDNKKIKELAYQQEPYSIIWVLQEEGSVLACTYLRQQNVIAWTHMDFGGKVLSLGVMSNGSNQELYLAVERKNGVFIEKMPYRMLDNDPKERFFVDCGSTYRGEPANIIAGLEYLEGESVVALADGYVVKDLVVENGQITLPTPASIVTVGLPYESVLETLTFDVSQGDGSNLNRKKRVVAVSVRYNNSRGSRISVNGHREVPMLERKIENTDTDISLKSGFYREILPSAHNEPTTIKIRQDEPLPLTIVSIIPELEYER